MKQNGDLLERWYVAAITGIQSWMEVTQVKKTIYCISLILWEKGL